MDLKNHKKMMLNCFLEILDGRVNGCKMTDKGKHILGHAYSRMREIDALNNDCCSYWVKPNTKFYVLRFGMNPLDLFKEVKPCFLLNRTGKEAILVPLRHTKDTTFTIHEL